MAEIYDPASDTWTLIAPPTLSYSPSHGTTSVERYGEGCKKQ
jgi:hypothetical protein